MEGVNNTLYNARSIYCVNKMLVDVFKQHPHDKVTVNEMTSIMWQLQIVYRRTEAVVLRR